MSDKISEWLKKHNFDQNGFTYILTGETYPIKDKLAAEGWQYDAIFKWHKADPTGYEDRVVKIDVNEVVDFSLWFDKFGEVMYFSEGIDKIDRLIDKKKAPVNTEWLDGDSIKRVPAILTNKNSYFGKFGLSNIYTFQTETNNVLVWFTTKTLKIELYKKCLVTGTIKDRKEFKGVKQTIITRCVVKEVENNPGD